jgi:glucose 1-dehydrogenase
MAAPTAATPFNTDLPNYKNLPKLLVGQKALVTGANSGIGQACAIALARAGAHVVVNYVVGETDTVIKAIEAEGRKGIAIKADVSNEAEVDAMFKQAIEQFGTLDILVANAGLQRDSTLVNMTMAQWNTVIGVNLTGQWLCARAAVKEFLRRGVRKEVSVAAGKIICMSSVHEVIPWAGHVNYATSKGGIHIPDYTYSGRRRSRRREVAIPRFHRRFYRRNIPRMIAELRSRLHQRTETS